MAYRTDTPHPAETNGERLSVLRRRKRWTQQRLAQESGYSLAAIRGFEQGRRSLDRGSVILALCRALDCHPTEITGQPYAPADGDRAGQEAAAAVAAVRRALLRHGRPTRPSDAEAAAVDLPDLQRRVTEANSLRQSAALARSASVLPQLLRDVQVACDVLADDGRRTAYGLLTSVYECAMQYLYKLGRVSDATLATERVLWSAERTEDPLRLIAARWYEAGEFLGIGEHDDAADIIDSALTALGRPGSPQELSLAGSFHLKAALNEARGGGREAERHLQHAQRLAETLGDPRRGLQRPDKACLLAESRPCRCCRWVC